ncbi:MAG TPA: transposase [Nitrososphaerales archaeon]|nr:transposase [Nitrososphaerales archaeon]
MKSVKQNYEPSEEVLDLLDTFRMMTNDCVRIGLANHNASTLKRLSLLCYKELSRYRIVSYYKLHAISRAAGILASRKKSIRRGVATKDPYAVRPQLVSSYGFRVENGVLRVPLGERRYFDIPLNGHTQMVLSEAGLKVRSFTLTASSVSLTVSKEVKEIECTGAAGLDRNLRNLTYGNEERVIQYDLSKAVKIAGTTREILSSFRRNDARIRRMIASKYGRRRRNRINHLLNCATKEIVEEAHEGKEAIVLEDIKGIRKLFARGNGQGGEFRGRMNSWSFGEAQRQIEYKAAWRGVPVIHLTKGETRGTTMECARCGERLQVAQRDDVRHLRQLWCAQCGRWVDRDVNAVTNQSRRGRLRFDRSLPDDEAKGEACEAMKGNLTTPVILRVDASKMTRRDNPKSYQNRRREVPPASLDR